MLEKKKSDNSSMITRLHFTNAGDEQKMGEGKRDGRVKPCVNRDTL